MKALSGYAEWFWLMAKGWKDVENRPKSLPKEIACSLPVRIYLHASKTKTPSEQLDFIREHLTSDQYAEYLSVDWDNLRGCIIGEITITKQMMKRRYKESDHVDIGSQQKELEIYIASNDPCVSSWFFGLFGYAVKEGILYESPIPYKGQLGFFEIELPE